MYIKAGNITLLAGGLGLICALLLWPAQAESRMQVLSSVKPVQLIVNGVAGDTVDSELLLSARISPHDFALRFSDLRRIQRADLFVWLGPQFEHYLVKPLQQRADENSVSLLANANAAESDTRHQDPHIWLDPLAVIASAERIAAALTAADSANAASYRSNLAVFQAQLQQLHQRIAARFAALAGHGVITTHAGLQHFLKRYGLAQVGSVYIGAEELLSLQHIERLRGRIKSGKTHCVMLEPQYERGKIKALFKGLDFNAVELDVLGANAGSYAEMLQAVSDAVYRCLAENNAADSTASGSEHQSASAK